MIENLKKSETQLAISKIQHLEGINFKYKEDNGSVYMFNFIGNTFKILFDPIPDKNIREREKLNNLIRWNTEITIKIIHLRNTFIYLSAYLNRFKKSNLSKDQQHYRYFSEIISYYFISIRDNILQLINSYIDSPIKEEYKVSLEKLIKNLNDEEFLKIINNFEYKTKRFREEIRNGFTHKTNPFNHYYLTTIDNDDNLGINYTNTIEDEEFYKELLCNLEHLSNYIDSLREKMQ
ncbi:hypothetical protein [Chryseobacterium sp. SIMBA_029]|uniref:hypothetical protein n=1 Tax=Chryseobacterium sp. SIMBA_029 TaxID=3085772 RepID=UPI003979292B